MSFFVGYIVPFIIALGVLILIHELGHYLVARWCGVKVLRFSVGFGRPLLKVQGSDGTEWVLAVFPLGGYVKMLGEGGGDEVEEHESHRAFNRQSVGRRFAIVAAGPVFNLLLAVALYWGVFVGGSDELRPLIAPAETQSSLARDAGVLEGDLVLSVDGNKIKSWQDLRWALLRHAVDRSEAHLLVRTRTGDEAVRVLDLRNFSFDETDESEEAGRKDPVFRMGLRPASVPALIAHVEEDGAAARGGLIDDDEIVAIDGEPMNLIREVVEVIHATPGQTLMFTVRRGEEERTFSVAVGEKRIGDDGAVGFIGVRFDTSALYARVSYGPSDAMARAVSRTWETSTLTLKSIGQMILGNISVKNISGPITIADIAGKSAQHGLASFIHFLAFISISLGILNLLPIPVLDGGHLLYYAVEFIKGSALSDRFMELGQKVGMVILLMLMVFALFNDINRLIF
ncbi:MAG: RIP metalloprotease RseP [Betaproteobacteria bacterium]|nr:RIP metalloprotease RseP [Betaproteobacteria bacterium]